jgi:hypothetical protein
MFVPQAHGLAMRGFNRATAVVILTVALTGWTCALPTDKSNEVFVVVQTNLGRRVVLQGEQLGVAATLWQRVGADSVEIKNAAFLWSTTDATLATVQDTGYGGAKVTGVKPGLVDLTVRAVSFEKAQTADVTLRVSKPLEIDSVRPSLVRFGDTITVYGVGVDSIFIAFLEGAVQLDYPIPPNIITRTRDSLGFARATFWVTPPARTAQLSFFGPGVFGDAPDTTRVLPFDVLEPNEIAPRSINLDGPPRVPTIPQIKFINPALAFEVAKRDSLAVDWYRFGQTTPRDLTLILTAPEIRGTFSTFLSDSLVFVPASPPNPPTYTIGPTSWTLGPGSHACRGFPFEPAELQPESTVVALAGMPAGTMHALSVYAQPGRYGLGVFEGYITTDPNVPRDAHEEDDFCNAADARGLAVTLPAGSFRDTLTIDNPHDIDWIRFRLSSGTNVTIKTTSLGSATTADTSDIDLFLLTVPGGGASNTLDVVQRSDGGGSTETISPLLPVSAGDYYLVVVDYQGAPVAYDLCISASGGCTPFPSQAAPARSPKRVVAPRPPLQVRVP